MKRLKTVTLLIAGAFVVMLVFGWSAGWMNGRKAAQQNEVPASAKAQSAAAPAAPAAPVQAPAPAAKPAETVAAEPEPAEPAATAAPEPATPTIEEPILLQEDALSDTERLESWVCKSGDKEKYFAVGWSNKAARVMVAAFCDQREKVLNVTETARVLVSVGLYDTSETGWKNWRAQNLLYLLSRRIPGNEWMSFYDAAAREHQIPDPVIIALLPGRPNCSLISGSDELAQKMRLACSQLVSGGNVWSGNSGYTPQPSTRKSAVEPAKEQAPPATATVVRHDPMPRETTRFPRDTRRR
jgi:hypothetical protein